MSQLKTTARRIVPWGLLAGMMVTLAFLGSMDFKPVPGCGETNWPQDRMYSLSGGCSTLEEGYPLRFLSTWTTLDGNPDAPAHSVGIGSGPVIDKSHLAEDWVIWSAVCCTVLYIASTGRARRWAPV